MTVNLAKAHDADCDCAAPYLASWHTAQCAYARRVMRASQRESSEMTAYGTRTELSGAWTLRTFPFVDADGDRYALTGPCAGHGFRTRCDERYSTCAGPTREYTSLTVAESLVLNNGAPLVTLSAR